MRAIAPRPRRLALALALAAAAAAAPASAQEAPALDESRLGGLSWREVGPYRGGRSAAVAGIPQDRDTYWFGGAGGGVWKTTDAGRSWTNMSDGWFGGSIGAVAVSEWDPNVVYVGGGEKTVRGNVSHGDGVWRSDDAGRTWTHVGLADSRHVSRIRIHPRDPELVYAAVMGHLFGPSEERGVFRSEDGGGTWERVLFANADAGAVDLVLDPTNPRILYASTWRIRRTPYSLESGGEGCGLWKSTDGGDTWTELTANPGLPDGTWGISGVSVSASNPDNLYAMVENADGGVFRSRDGGETWARTNDSRDLRQRAWYYTRLYADPVDEEAVYVLNVGFHFSKDGGRTFSRISVPHGDNHDMWIDPADPERMVQANDGGANVSFDRGETWSTQANQPTAQMYRVSVDDDFPYRLLGGQQDNSTVRIRSRSLERGSVGVRDWEPTAGGESGHVVAKPGSPHIVYGGSYGGTLTRVDHLTGERRSVHVWPDDPLGWGAGDLKYRFNWNFPIFFSPHDPDRLYAAANVLFRTTDEGASWQEVSPDLTRAEPSMLGPSGGPITKDNTSVEYYATIFAAFESPHEAGVLWCGSDDGLVHLSRDDGASWTDVTPPDMPEWTMVNSLEAHPFEEGGCYLAGTRYKLDDFEPYLYRTTDWGATWTRIDAGIDRAHFTRVVRADPVRRGLLYAGTERGVYASLDDGASWSPLQLDLPVAPVTDLAVAFGDLVAATQGRGYWILDDLSPLRQLDPAMAADTVHLFTPRPSYRMRTRRSPDPEEAGTNPQGGAWIAYTLPDELPGEVSLAIHDPDGELVRTYTAAPGEDEDRAPLPAGQTDDPRQLPTEPGLNRFHWDLRHTGAEEFDGMVLWNGNLSGPLGVPGTYRAVLTVGEETREADFLVIPDPRSSATPADFRAQLAFLEQVRGTLTDAHRAIRDLREARAAIEAVAERLPEDGEGASLAATAEDLVQRMTSVEEALYQTQNRSRQDPLNFPIRLTDKLAALNGHAGQGDRAPTAQMEGVRVALTTAIEAELAKLDEIWDELLPAFNRRVLELEVPPVPSPGD